MSIFDWLSQSSQKRAVERFMVKIINHQQLLANTRKDREQSRTPISLGLRVVEWNDGGVDPDIAFDSATRDVTLQGISFVSPRPFAPREKLAISILFEGEYHHLLGEVRHTTMLGTRQLLIGCQLLSPLPSMPELRPAEATTGQTS